MPRKHNFTRKQRVEIALRAKGLCEKCGAKLKPSEGDADHIIPVEMGGESTLENGQWLCKPCHKSKTAKDVKTISKSNRQRDKAIGAIKPKGTIKSQGFAKVEKPEKPQPFNGLPRRRLYEEK